MVQPSQPLFRAVRRGWRWWTNEIASLFAIDRLAGNRKSTPGLVVCVEAGGLRLIDERAAATRHRRKSEVKGEDVFEALLGLARSGMRTPVWLRLPLEACFVRHAELPAAAADHADRFLELDLERATPFRGQDVYTAHVIDPLRSSTGTLGVTQFIVRRSSIDSVLADMRATGVEIAGIDCWSEDGKTALPVNFIPREPGATPSNPVARVNRMLAAAGLALLILAGYMGLDAHERALAELSRQTAEARGTSEEARRRSLSAEAAAEDARAVTALRAAEMPMVEVLDHVTRLLPDTVWLSDLRVEGSEIEVTGEATTAAPLLALVENSEIFDEASFSSPINREPGGKERFSLRAKLAPAAARSPPSSGKAAP